VTAPSAPGSAGRVRVAVVYGGRSSEHAISCVSAGSILRNLDPERFEVVAVGITPGGSWVLTDGSPETLAITDGRLPQVSAESGTELALPADPVRGGQLLSLGQGGEMLAGLDVVFPVLHGPYGEDGTIQGLLELAGVPYVGAGVLGSAVAMDKEVTKRLLQERGLPVAEFVVLSRREYNLDELCARLPFPMFVKPANLGSSVGISKVKTREELVRALAYAGEFDRKILVERGITGREFECSVLGNHNPVAAVPCEILPSLEFYDYEDKYLLNKAQTVVPADLQRELERRPKARASFAELSSQNRYAIIYRLKDAKKTETRARRLAMDAVAKVFNDFDVVVAPTSGEQLVITNLTGHPAVILPNGLRGSDAPKYPSDDVSDSQNAGGPGTPTSLTFLGKLYGEAELLAFARAYQEATGFHLQHPKLTPES